MVHDLRSVQEAYRRIHFFVRAIGLTLPERPRRTVGSEKAVQVDAAAELFICRVTFTAPSSGSTPLPKRFA